MDNEKNRDNSRDKMIREKRTYRNIIIVMVVVTLAIVLIALWQGAPWWVILIVIVSALLTVIIGIGFYKFLKKMDEKKR